MKNQINQTIRTEITNADCTHLQVQQQITIAGRRILTFNRINNYIAYSTKKNLMQFFGAISIKSELILEELNNFYSKYRENEWSYIVEKQVSNNITFIEHRDLKFKALKADETLINYYIVYTWGSSDYPLSDLDIRGH
ncbi:hypothetical protein [Paenibacillus etheri]|nr:hypothetical protein [Paenibacillus etheri]